MRINVMALPSRRPQAARSILRLIVAAMLAMTVPGCASGDDPRVEPLRPQVRAQAVQPSTQRPRLPAGETLNRVAVLVPLSGSSALLGQSILNAANLAVADAGGGRIRITGYDTARGAAAAVDRALAEGNGLILGPLASEDVRIAAPIARRAGVTVVAYANQIDAAGEGAYALGLGPDQSIARVVAFARSRGARRFGGLVPAGHYGERAALALREAVQRSGGTLLAIQRYDRSAASLRAAARGLVPAGEYDAVLVADGSRVAVQATPLIRAGNPDARILGTEAWATEGNGGGGNAQLRGAWYAAASDTLFDQLRTRYRTRFNRDPYRLASLGYDSVLLAMRVAADWPVGRPFPVRQLRADDGFLGVDGAFRFGRDGVVQRALEVREVTAAGLSVVSPAPRAFN
jgi:ABC-type branched-subunit amino acid transport system substrate-binding protein